MPPNFNEMSVSYNKENSPPVNLLSFSCGSDGDDNQISLQRNNDQSKFCSNYEKNHISQSKNQDQQFNNLLASISSSLAPPFYGFCYSTKLVGQVCDRKLEKQLARNVHNRQRTQQNNYSLTSPICNIRNNVEFLQNASDHLYIAQIVSDEHHCVLQLLVRTAVDHKSCVANEVTTDNNNYHHVTSCSYIENNNNNDYNWKKMSDPDHFVMTKRNFCMMRSETTGFFLTHMFNKNHYTVDSIILQTRITLFIDVDLPIAGNQTGSLEYNYKGEKYNFALDGEIVSRNPYLCEWPHMGNIN